MISISNGFVTNSSTFTAIVLLPREILDKLLTIRLETYIDKYFDEFVDRMGLWDEDFIDEVKLSIPKVMNEIYMKLKLSDSNMVKIMVECDVQGNGIDTSEPKAYALLFINLYVLNEYAIDTFYCK